MERETLEVKGKPDEETIILSEEQFEKAQEASAGEITLDPQPKAQPQPQSQLQPQPKSQDIQHDEKINLLCKNFTK